MTQGIFTHDMPGRFRLRPWRGDPETEAERGPIVGYLPSGPVYASELEQMIAAEEAHQRQIACEWAVLRFQTGRGPHRDFTQRDIAQ